MIDSLMTASSVNELPSESLYIALAYLLLFAQGFNSSL